MLGRNCDGFPKNPIPGCEGLCSGAASAVRSGVTARGGVAPPRRGRFAGSLLATAVALAASSASQLAWSATGDFSLDWTASAPETYDHNPGAGGGAYNDKTVGVDKDIVESLEGGDFACGDTVTYLLKVGNDGQTPGDNDQTIEVDLEFLADTTGQSGIAHVDVTNVKINYGEVTNGDDYTGINPPLPPPFPFGKGLDSGILDDRQYALPPGDLGPPLGSTATIVVVPYFDECQGGGPCGPYITGSVLKTTVSINDLDSADQSVVLRVDTRLGCKPDTNPTGNLQAKMAAARLTAIGEVPIDPPQDIPGGEQTTPFRQLGDAPGTGTPLIRIIKTAMVAGGTCGGDDVDPLEGVAVGSDIQYCYEVVNDGSEDLCDVRNQSNPTGAQFGQLVDNNGTPLNLLDDFLVTLTAGFQDLCGSQVGYDLPAGGVASATGVSSSMPAPAGILDPGGWTNIALVWGDDGAGNYQFDTDPATVIGGLDWGDLPDTGTGTGAGNYRTLLADNGARHVPVGVMLGDDRDVEVDGQPSAGANEDDLNQNPPADDEDGVIWLDPISPNRPFVPVRVTSSGTPVTGTGGGILNAWIDFNADGDFADPGEQIFTNQPLASGDNTLYFATPSYTFSQDQRYARFRITDQTAEGGDAPDGLADSGEVEDYTVPSSPTAVELVYFQTYKLGRAVFVEWQTANEIGTIRFYVERLDPRTGKYVGVGYAFSKGPAGGVYRLLDATAKPGNRYTYRLTEESVSGPAEYIYEDVKAEPVTRGRK